MRRRPAFTLIELLIVMGIIAILVTLVTLGARHVSKTSRDKATRVAMDNLKSMITERDVTGGLAAINGVFASTPPKPLPAPGSVEDGSADRIPAYAGTPPKATNGMAATQTVMALLRAVPNNAKWMTQIPADQVWQPPVGNAPLVLDAWHNPIIYVPPMGLAGVCVTGDDPSTPATETKRYVTITAPDGRGFWASAGPDGAFGILPGGNGMAGTPTPDADDITAGDDNLYSFDN